MLTAERNGDVVSVLDRTSRLLDVFSVDCEEITLAELSRRSGLPKTTVHRLTTQLVALNVLERSDGRFRLGPRLFELGQLVWHQRGLRERTLPFMQDLYERTHETVQLATLDGSDTFYLEILRGHRRVASPARRGGRVPANCTALGKAALAFSAPPTIEGVLTGGLAALTPRSMSDPRRLAHELVEIRHAGVAFDNEESQRGLCCVAGPIVARDGTAVAAISVSCDRRYPHAQGPLAAAVRSAAHAASLELQRYEPIAR